MNKSTMSKYEYKYLKYKAKYLSYKKHQFGGGLDGLFDDTDMKDIIIQTLIKCYPNENMRDKELITFIKYVFENSCNDGTKYTIESYSKLLTGTGKGFQVPIPPEYPNIYLHHYIDGVQIPWCNWTRYIRGSHIYINPATHQYLPLKITLSRAPEAGSAYLLESGVADTQEGAITKNVNNAQFGRPYRFFMKSTLEEKEERTKYRYDAEIHAKADGQLLILTLYKRDSEQCKILETILRRLEDTENNIFSKALYNYYNQRGLDYLPVISSNKPLFINDMNVIRTTITSTCVGLGLFTDDNLRKDDKNIMKLAQIMIDKFLQQINNMQLKDGNDKTDIKSYMFESICRNQTDAWDNKIPGLTLSYEKSALIFLGARFYGDNCGIYYPHSKFIKETVSFETPLYWKVENPQKVIDILVDTSNLLENKITMDNFLKIHPAGNGEKPGEKSFHYEGFVMSLWKISYGDNPVPNTSEYTFADPISFKLKLHQYYNLHKAGDKAFNTMKLIPIDKHYMFPIIEQYRKFIDIFIREFVRTTAQLQYDIDNLWANVIEQLKTDPNIKDKTKIQQYLANPQTQKDLWEKSVIFKYWSACKKILDEKGIQRSNDYTDEKCKTAFIGVYKKTSYNILANKDIQGPDDILLLCGCGIIDTFCKSFSIPNPPISGSKEINYKSDNSDIRYYVINTIAKINKEKLREYEATIKQNETNISKWIYEQTFQEKEIINELTKFCQTLFTFSY